MTISNPGEHHSEGGYAVGPVGATDSILARFDGTSGKLLKPSSGATVVTQPGLASINFAITTNNTKDLWYTYGACTLIGIRWRAASVGVAGTFKLRKNGVDIPGLTGLVPSISQATATATTPVSLVAGDVITIVADGTLAAVGDLNLSPNFTVTYPI